ncbi:MAG TPA: hypothetical protein VHZ95_04700, partial [Polyangiales bacterium]|nr:hypothetical protein [Polyangiales bacterium]
MLDGARGVTLRDALGFDRLRLFDARSGEIVALFFQRANLAVQRIARVELRAPARDLFAETAASRMLVERILNDLRFREQRVQRSLP